MKPGDLVFDVGANAGNRTKIFLQLGTRVISVEPQKECVRTLFIRYHDHPEVRIVPKALGASEGTAEMLIYHRFNCMSSLNRAWALARDMDGLYGRSCPDEERRVKVTTLNTLIEEFGPPSFIKIDVEGYEYEVLRGLSQPVKALSFEFLPVYLETALKSIDYLQRFGPMRLNYAIMERMELVLEDWVDPEKMVKILKSYEHTREFLSGDVYVRFIEETQQSKTPNAVPITT
jgi:FkbM family methyltransferase